MSERMLYFNGLDKDKIDALYAESFGSRYHEYRRRWQEATQGKLQMFPIQLDVEAIDACNLRCAYCLRNDYYSSKMGIRMNTGKRMPMSLYAKILEQAQQGGVRALNLGFSGECLIREDLPEMINKAADKGIFDIRILTNGLLMTPELTERLLDSQLTLFSLSVDAASPEVFKKLKGQDGLKKIHQGLRNLFLRRRERGQRFPLIRVTYYMSPENRVEADQCVRDLADTVDMIHLKGFLDLDVVKPEDQIVTDCRMPFQRLSIYADGRVAPCCTMFFAQRSIIGNVYESTLQEIWDSAQHRAICEGLASGSPTTTCVECLQNSCDA